MHFARLCATILLNVLRRLLEPETSLRQRPVILPVGGNV